MSLNDAIALAAEKAGISDDYKIRIYPIQKPPLEELIQSLSGEYESKILSEKLDLLYPYIKSIETLKELQGVQARSLIKVGF